MPLPTYQVQDAAGNDANSLVYNSSAPTLSSGQEVKPQADVNGNTKGTLATALSSLIDTITAYYATDAIMSGTNALTPLFAPITASSSGVTNLIALVSSKKIRVLSVVLVANAAVNVKFQSHVTPTDLTGLLYLGANGGFSAPFRYRVSE